MTNANISFSPTGYLTCYRTLTAGRVKYIAGTAINVQGT